ncbi:MAG: outer membrane lipoprotein-sorting protein [Deltaproteobacteria bacterium]|jgi:hypothetical protein|nr:outer membrane lipoprotein-sorting protein [Deltaproteobacteria bacterium]MBW2503882.1 outer membrane lipoprotein-sorting protein [Deltaproteobacteria bacterium]
MHINPLFFIPKPVLFLIFFSVLSVCKIVKDEAWALDLKALIRDVEQQYMGESSVSQTHMQVSTKNWQRNLEMQAWSLGRDFFLIRIIEPAKERDIATLKRNREVWNYLPKVDRIIKVPPSMMGGSWMGSHITNDDLVKANHIDEDYTLRLIEETELHFLIECLPKTDAAVVWGKIIYKVRKQPKVPELIAYFDESMQKVREIYFDDVQTIGERTIPLKLTVLPLDKPGEKTILFYREINYDVSLDEHFFTLRSLKQR